jgi:acyl-CoA thioester hydrolase
MKWPHIFKFRICFADTDAGGIVYHARYIEIAERARMELFADANEHKGGFVIRELAVKYMKPLRLNDIVVVETRFPSHTGATMEIEHKFIKDGEVYVVMTGTAVYVNKELKPMRLSEAWLDYLKPNGEKND